MLNFKNKNIMFIGAHPDDIEINAGGTIAKLSKNGENVLAFVCTCGKNTERVVEAKTALMTLGVKKSLICNFPDTELELHKARIIHEMDEFIAKNNIDTVFTHYSFDTHQDHRTVHEASMAAARRIKNIFLFKPTYPAGQPIVSFQPNVVVRLNDYDISRKIKALECHKSQIIKYGEAKFLNAMIDIAKADAWVVGGFHGYCELFQAGSLLCN